MVLSRTEIESMAIAIMKDFNSIFWKNLDIPYKSPQATPIDQFATEYLGLDVTFYPLSKDGSFLGLTAYADTEYILNLEGKQHTLPLKKNQVVLDNGFIDPVKIKDLCGKRRFTLAHECAHQILYALEQDEGKTACRRLYSERRVYDRRSQRKEIDWTEWQADSLGAAILMPSHEIQTAMEFLMPQKKLVTYGNKVPEESSLVLTRLCKLFGVSKTAMSIRLKHLGYVQDLPLSMFFGPAEVVS